LFGKSSSCNLFASFPKYQLVATLFHNLLFLKKFRTQRKYA